MVRPCMEAMQAVLATSATDRLSAVFKKYQHPCRQKVASILPPPVTTDAVAS